MFISSAYAATGLVQSSIMSNLSNFVPLIVIVIIFYFLVIRPQQKKLKNHLAMINDLKKGDKIITAGGILATVVKLDGDGKNLLVEIAPEVKIKIRKDTVAQALDNEKKSKL
jgi:preprotein translocase subunit YajC